MTVKLITNMSFQGNEKPNKNPINSSEVINGNRLMATAIVTAGVVSILGAVIQNWDNASYIITHFIK